VKLDFGPANATFPAGFVPAIAPIPEISQPRCPRVFKISSGARLSAQRLAGLRRGLFKPDDPARRQPGLVARRQDYVFHHGAYPRPHTRGAGSGFRAFRHRADPRARLSRKPDDSLPRSTMRARSAPPLIEDRSGRTSNRPTSPNCGWCRPTSAKRRRPFADAGYRRLPGEGWLEPAASHQNF